MTNFWRMGCGGEGRRQAGGLKEQSVKRTNQGLLDRRSLPTVLKDVDLLDRPKGIDGLLYVGSNPFLVGLGKERLTSSVRAGKEEREGVLRTMLPMNPPLTDRTTLSASSGYLSKYLRRSLMLPIWSGLPLGGNRRAVVRLSASWSSEKLRERRTRSCQSSRGWHLRSKRPSLTVKQEKQRCEQFGSYLNKMEETKGGL